MIFYLLIIHIISRIYLGILLLIVMSFLNCDDLYVYIPETGDGKSFNLFGYDVIVTNGDWCELNNDSVFIYESFDDFIHDLVSSNL